MSDDLLPVNDRIDLAIDWIRNKAPRTISGGGEGERSLLMICHMLRGGFALNDDTTFSLLKDYLNPDQAPSDRWSETELRHKIKESSKQPTKIQYGSKVRARGGNNGSGRIIRPTFKVGTGTGELDRAKWTDPLELPEPKRVTPEEFLGSLFGPDEHVHIRYSTAEGENRVFNSGLTKTLREWLSLANMNGGLANVLTSDATAEFFVCPNPMKPGGRKDEDVAEFRITVLEFDEWKLEEQHNLIKSCGVPGTHLLYTAGRSLHCLVPVVAKDRDEFDQRRAFLDDYLRIYKPDSKCKNPSRMTRIPGTMRDGKMVSLLDTGIGAGHWDEFYDEKSLELVGKLMTVDNLLEVSSHNPNNLIGNRWLERGTAAMFFGPTGIGKSVLVMMMAGCWTLGLAFFGVRPAFPLRIGILQAENTEEDMREAFRAMCDGLRKMQEIEEGSPRDVEMMNTLRKNFRMIKNDKDTGEVFVERSKHFILRFNLDLCIVDPFLAYAGADASDQKEISKLLRNQLNPMLAATRCAMLFVHHIGKPKSDQKGGKVQQPTIYQMAYAGLGSSELMNWPRAIIALDPVGTRVFRLAFAKRGGRSGLVDAFGKRTNEILIKHSNDPSAPWWERADTSDVAADTPKKESTHEKPALTSKGWWRENWGQFMKDQWEGIAPLSRGDLLERISDFWFKLKGDRPPGSPYCGTWTACFQALKDLGFVTDQKVAGGNKKIFFKTDASNELALNDRVAPPPTVEEQIQEVAGDDDFGDPLEPSTPF